MCGKLPGSSSLRTMRVTLRSLLNLARNKLKAEKLPLRSFFRGVSLALDVPGHVRLLRVLAHPGVLPLAQRCPRLAYRYLGEFYLAKGLSRKARLSILTNHYAYLRERVAADFFAKIYDARQLAWRDDIDGHRFDIVMFFPKDHDREGEVCLAFECDGVRLYELSFTIGAGPAIGLPCGQAVLISHVQGVAGAMDLTRAATRVCHGSAPPYLLLAAVEGIALALEIDMLVGVGTNRQCLRPAFNHDDFWRSLSGAADAADFYPIALPFPEKPIELIKRNHRARSLRRRALRSRIAEQVRMFFKQVCLKRAG